MPEMSFASSRGGAPRVSLSHAMAQGLAPDGGLYVPCEMPTIDAQALSPRLSLPEIARLGLAGFFAADGLRDELAAIADAALNIPAPATPVTGARDPLFVLELYHGPTAAFKDFDTVLEADPAHMASDVMFGRDNRLMEGEQYRAVAFRKRRR